MNNEPCGCCGEDIPAVMLVADDKFGQVCPACDLYMMEQSVEE